MLGLVLGPGCWILVCEWDEGGGLTFLFYVLPLAGLCPFGDGFGEERHELAIAGWGASVSS